MHATDKTTARRKWTWPDPLPRRQESPANRRHATAPSASVKEVARGTFFLVRRLRVRLGVRLQQTMPAAPPGARSQLGLMDRYIVLLRCCILLLYQALEL